MGDKKGIDIKKCAYKIVVDSREKKIQKTGLFPRKRPVRRGKSSAGSNLVATQKLEVPGGPAPQALPGLFGSILVDMGGWVALER